jgi:hypothetical protein
VAGVEVEVGTVVDVDVDVGVDSDVDAKVCVDSDVDVVDTNGAVVTARTTVVSMAVVGADVEVEVDAEVVGRKVDA